MNPTVAGRFLFAPGDKIHNFICTGGGGRNNYAAKIRRHRTNFALCNLAPNGVGQPQAKTASAAGRPRYPLNSKRVSSKAGLGALRIALVPAGKGK